MLLGQGSSPLALEVRFLVAKEKGLEAKKKKEGVGVGRERKGGGRPGFGLAAFPVPGGGCLSRAWLPEKQRQRRKEGGKPRPRGWAKVVTSQRGRGGEEHLSPPAPRPESEKNKKYIYKRAQQPYAPSLSRPPHRRTHSKTKREMTRDTATSPGASLPQRGLGS